MAWNDRFREDNELLLEFIGGWRGKVYLAIAAATFLSQIRERLLVCDGALACWTTTAKAAVWSLVWPVYWISYVTDFILFKPYG